MSQRSTAHAHRARPATAAFAALPLLLLAALAGCERDTAPGNAPGAATAVPANESPPASGTTTTSGAQSANGTASANAPPTGGDRTAAERPSAPGPSPAEPMPPLDDDDVAAAARLIGLEFTPDERTLMLGELERHRAEYAALRGVALPNAVPPRAIFEAPRTACTPDSPPADAAPAGRAPGVERPADLEQLAYASVAELGELIRTRTISVTELTRMFLDRLARHDAELAAVVTLTEQRALAQAAELDRELAAGRYRGPLHGIPYGAKDLFAVEGYPTTWGATPYRDQTIAATASVVSRLDEAGAVLIAKLSLGALALGDVWFGGQTHNPWNLEQGSSGSSAGSAASVAAGLVPFALGSETLGSIVSPATRVGVTGLRPTFGRVSRHGVMSLAWSMDKVGILCRDAETCATVFGAIAGCDGLDPSVVDAPFEYPPELGAQRLRVGYAPAELAAPRPGREQSLATLAVLEQLGAELVPLELPALPIDSLTIVLFAEAAAAFDELTRSGADDLLVRQTGNAWPNIFRAARLIPAVEYIQANRVRTLLAEAMAERFAGVDVYVAASLGPSLTLTNLTGHPAVVVPNGFIDEHTPTSITFIGKPFDEATPLALAARYQAATSHHRRRPPAFDPAAGN